MLVKLYGMTWIIGIFVAALFFVTGNLTPIASVVFGFITFGMVFMGMMGVLPSTVGHHEPALAKVEVATTPATERIGNRIRSYKETLSSSGVAVQKPRHP